MQSSADVSASEATEQDTGYVSAPAAIALPKGGGAVQGMGEKFDVNPVTGTGSLSIPIVVSPGRAGFLPQLTLSYDSGAGNSPFGLGWNLSMPSITRKTQKGLPQYRDAEDSDTFVLSGAEDLVPTLLRQGNDWVRDVQTLSVPEDVIDRTLIPSARVDDVLTSYPSVGTYTVQRYRPRMEGLFARIERWQHQESGDVHWRSLTPDNVTSVYGKTPESHIADPTHPARVFEWRLCESYDDKGNVIRYEYKPENAADVSPALVQEKNRLANGHSYAQHYLKRIVYGNQTPYERDHWHFQVVFDYGEHGTADSRLDDAIGDEMPLEERDAADYPTPSEDQSWPYRPDAFSTFRSGFEIRTQRLCRRVLMFHRFDELGSDWELVRSTDFQYEKHPVATYLITATQTGYVRDSDTTYGRRSHPPVTLTYDRPQLHETIQSIDGESLENLPIGLDGNAYQWVDLHGEGIAGILTQQSAGWFYKANWGGATFAPVRPISPRPSVADLSNGQQRIVDLAGDGHQDLLVLSPGLNGFYERGVEQDWANFKSFKSLPKVDWRDPNLKWIDLTGDGHADLLISEQEVFVWYPSEAEAGFGESAMVRKLRNEEQGPALVFADGEQSVYLSDMTGDGLNDIVRIRNGAVCYWPNLGYGRFGAKVTMGQAPYFDHPELFQQGRIRLADIDGSGTTDIIYLGRDTVSLWFNQSGNAWSKPHRLRQFPQVDDLTSVQVVDLLGNGTACLVWSSPLPSDRPHRMQYIDLMGGQKPHLLRQTQNNLGAETHLHYAPSTQFYLADQQAGTPWLTKIPFPVQVVEQVETLDRISGNRFVSRYRYRHGYFDGEEREFRGFGYVEQVDTESFAAFEAAGSTNATAAAFHVPPVLTKTWFHTGVYRDRLSHLFTEEYYDADPQAIRLPDTTFPDGLTLIDGSEVPQRLTPQEAHEVCRALKGSILRQEVYALDESDQSAHPYTVSESSYQVRWLQPRQEGQYGVFFVHPQQALNYAYDRNPEDPRLSQSLTLEVDAYGTVRKSAAIVYPRRAAQQSSHPVVRTAQAQTFITYTDVEVIHRPDAATFYRLGLPFETRAYEITGLQGNEATPFTPAGLWAEIQAAAEIPYEAQPTAGQVQKRLVERDRIQYLSNDLTGPLLWGEVESLALPDQTYRLAFTPELLERVYGDRVSDALLQEEGRYVWQDGLWWIPSGRQIFAADQFYLPTQIIDPFGQITTTTYDEYTLLTVQTVDPLGNTIQVENDYRVLQPWQLTNPNENRSQVRFDALGMVAATAVMGKAGEDQGDLLDATVKADLLPADLAAFDADPLGTAAVLLGNATTRIVYDLDRYRQSGEPVFAATLARETHVNDSRPADGLKIQVGFGYSDGFGREIQSKMQAEPGPLDLTVADAPTIAPRWVGTGWTIFNNKGKPVKQYEPFFSATHQFELARQVGVSPTLLYDPIQRVVATLAPNNTYSKVVFDAWQQATWDGNDTVRQDPATDGDVGSYVQGLPAAEYRPTWYEQRHAGALGTAAQSAAQKAAAHANTPSVVHLDTLGRPILTIEDNGPDGQYETCVGLDIEGHQLYVMDARNNPVMAYAVVRRDGAGVPLRDALGNPLVETSAYNLLGHSLYSLSADAGERWMLNNVAGNPIRGWNSRGYVTRMQYDELQRPTHLYVRQEDGPETLAERTVYGDDHPEALSRNLKGQVLQQFDSAGVVTTWAVDFKGNPLRTSRQLTREYRQQANWSAVAELTAADPAQLVAAAAPLLESRVYDALSSFDALNRPLTMTTPDGSEARPTYNEANLLEAMTVRLRGAADFTPFVTDIDYNEKGQRTRITYGNGVTTTYTYDPDTFRLTRLHTVRAHRCAPLQDLNYTYDPVGNITAIRDAAQRTIFFDGEVVSPSTDYQYDAIYRLVQAKGREHRGQTVNNQPLPSDLYNYNDAGRTGLPHPQVGGAMRNYTESYTYDGVGNILEMAHRAAGGDWTRGYSYADNNNRLEATSLPGDEATGSHSARYEYDVHGNMIQMPHLSLMQWDFKDQLQASAKQVRADGGAPEITYYLYDAAGQRVRKVTERQAAPGEVPKRMKERIYLGGFEIYREYGGDGEAVKLERETLHVMDDQQRIALVETQTASDPDQLIEETPLFVPLIRYQLGNHLGSASVELDADASVISYEEYHPYGSTSYQAVKGVAEVSLKRYRYTGQERDEETGFHYYGSRYYMAWMGVWISPDPLRLSVGINFYSYVGGKPTILFDQDGLAPKLALTNQQSSQVQAVMSGDKNLFHAKLTDEANSHFIIMKPESLSIAYRDTSETYTQMAIRQDETNQYDIVISGIVLDEMPGVIETKMSTTPLDPARTKYAGQVVEAGKISGRESPLGYSISYKTPDAEFKEDIAMYETLGMPTPSVMLTPELKLRFQMGDPDPTSDVGVGGLAPIIIGGLPMGDQNLYKSDAPPGGVDRGKPQETHSEFLTQRNNEGYAALKLDSPQGLVILGQDQESSSIFLFIQEDNKSGFEMDQVRDFLLSQGVDDAVAMDSGGASMLIKDEIIEVMPDFWREKTMPMGLHFTVKE